MFKIQVYYFNGRRNDRAGKTHFYQSESVFNKWLKKHTAYYTKLSKKFSVIGYKWQNNSWKEIK